MLWSFNIMMVNLKICRYLISEPQVMLTTMDQRATHKMKVMLSLSRYIKQYQHNKLLQILFEALKDAFEMQCFQGYIPC